MNHRPVSPLTLAVAGRVSVEVAFWGGSGAAVCAKDGEAVASQTPITQVPTSRFTIRRSPQKTGPCGAAPGKRDNRIPEPGQVNEYRPFPGRCGILDGQRFPGGTTSCLARSA